MKIFMAFTICFACFIAYADALVVKGVDGSYLPSLAESWKQKGGGVLFKIADSVDISVLKERIAEAFPEMNTEVTPEGIFFLSANIETLLKTVGGVDLKISVKQDISTEMQKNRIEKQKIRKVSEVELDAAQKEEYAEAVIESVVLDGYNGLAKAEVKIKKASETGKFKNISGSQKIRVFFKMKDKKISANDEENKKRSDILMAKKGASVFIKIESRESDGSLIVSSVIIKKLQ